MQCLRTLLQTSQCKYFFIHFILYHVFHHTAFANIYRYNSMDLICFEQNCFLNNINNIPWMWILVNGKRKNVIVSE